MGVSSLGVNGVAALDGAAGDLSEKGRSRWQIKFCGPEVEMNWHL